MVPNFKVSDQPMTSEVRSNTAAGRLARLSSGCSPERAMDRIEQLGAKLSFNTSQQPEIDLRRKLCNSRSFDVSDVI